MSSGIQQSDLSPEVKQALEDMRDQLLILLVLRNGGQVTIPVTEIDKTGPYLLSMQVVDEHGQQCFRFVTSKKQ